MDKWCIYKRPDIIVKNPDHIAQINLTLNEIIKWNLEKKILINELIKIVRILSHFNVNVVNILNPTHSSSVLLLACVMCCYCATKINGSLQNYFIFYLLINM